MHIEFEAKFYIDVESFYKLLQQQNAQNVKKNTLMKRVIFEAPGAKDSQIRVRDEGDDIRLSYKLYNGLQQIDSVQEVDILVNDFDKTCEILIHLGLKKIRYVQNYREVFRLDGCFLMIDQWPALPPILEIEGDSEEMVESVVKKLGFSMDSAKYGPTALLYQEQYGISRQEFEKIDILTFDNIPTVFKKSLQSADLD